VKLNPELIQSMAEEDPDLAERLGIEWREAMIVMARHDPSAFCEYVLRNEKTSGPIYQHPDHEEIHKTILANNRTAIWTHPEFGKGIPLSSEIPTPSGWVRVGDLEVGGHVFAATGAPTEITWVGPVNNIAVYEVEFDDGDVVLADEEHLWVAHHSNNRTRNKGSQRLVSTKTLAASVRRSDGRCNWAIPLAGAAQYPERQLPVHPYVLGVWLGDGDSGRPTLTLHEDDREIYDRCASLISEAGREVRDSTKPHILRNRLGGRGFSSALRGLGVLGKAGCKFIPSLYLRASVEQRKELLAGLLDTDGCVYTRSGGASFVEVSFSVQQLATGTLELIRSLGFKARMRSEPSTLDGRVVGIRHRIFFTAHEPVFRLERKLAKQRIGAVSNSKAVRRHIVRITEVPSVPTRCIRVADPSGTFLLGRSYTVTHNCPVKGSRVLLGDWTWAKIETLCDQEVELVAWDEWAQKLKKVRAKVSFNGNRRCKKFTMANGTILSVTEDHPLMTEAFKWVRAGDLTSTEGLIAVGNIEVPHEDQLASAATLPEDEALILGFLLAGRITNEEKVVVRRIEGNERIRNKRNELFAAAGWSVQPFRSRTELVSVSETCPLSPAAFLRSHAEVVRGWPVRLLGAAAAAPVRQVERILSGFFSAAFHGIEDAKNGRLNCTIGVGPDRVPSGFLCGSREVAEMVQLLLLRVGAQATIKKHEKNLLALQGGGIWTEESAVGSPGRRVYPAWMLAVHHPDISRFWPTRLPVPSITRALTSHAICSIETLNAEVYAVEVFDVCHSFIQEGFLSHNTNQVSIGHVLWRIGKDPNTAIAILSNTGGMAAKIVSSLKTYIASSPELHDVFPHLKPGEKWAETAFTVDRTSFRKDPTVQAIGLTGNIVGTRLDGLVVDDLDDMDTTRTPEAREHTQFWVRKQALTRLGQDGWATMIGNVWHENDTMHSLSKSGSWKRLRYPVMLPDGFGNWKTRDTVNFPMERILSIRDDDLGPVAFQQLYMLSARADGEQRFREEWILKSLDKGKGQGLYREGLMKTPQGCRAITGVDLGVKKKASADPTVITTILEIPLGGERYEMCLLNVVKGRWNANEIMEKIREQQRLFGSEVWVEANAAQDFLVQLLNMSGGGIQVKAFYTGKNKYDPMFGVESIAAEMSVGLWSLPSWDGTREGCEQEVEELVQEMLAYTPGNHTGDMLMSIWIAREAARSSRKQRTGTVEFGRLNLRRR